MTQSPPSKKEIQLERLLCQATSEYGQVEKKIIELEKLRKPSGPKPPGWADNDQLIQYQINMLRNYQKIIVSEVISKSEQLSKNANPEISERLIERTQTWADSDLVQEALEIESNTDLTNEQERLLNKIDLEGQDETQEEKIENLNSFAEKMEKAEKIEKAVEFRENDKDITNSEEEKKAAAEAQERQKQIEELRQKFAQNRELYKGRNP